MHPVFNCLPKIDNTSLEKKCLVNDINFQKLSHTCEIITYNSDGYTYKRLCFTFINTIFKVIASHAVIAFSGTSISPIWGIVWHCPKTHNARRELKWARLNLTLFNVFLDRHLSNSVWSVGHTWPQALSALFGAEGTPENVLKEF